VLAGLAIILTDTPGQRELPPAWATAARCAAPRHAGDGRRARRLGRTTKPSLARAKAAAWRAAQRRWHWEHPEDSGALVGAVEKALR